MRYLILKIGRRSFLALQNLRGYLSVFLFHWLSKSAKVTFRGCEVHIKITGVNVGVNVGVKIGLAASTVIRSPYHLLRSR